MTGPLYRVIWLHSVRAVWLGELLLDLSARGESSQPVFDAMDRITSRLAVDPDEQGESRPEGTRVLVHPPLTVTFEVHTDDRSVVVVHAHYARRPGGPSA
jgi:hypothetical protein